MVYIYEENMLETSAALRTRIIDTYFNVHHHSSYEVNKEAMHSLVDNIHGRYTINSIQPDYSSS